MSCVAAMQQKRISANVCSLVAKFHNSYSWATAFRAGFYVVDAYAKLSQALILTALLSIMIRPYRRRQRQQSPTAAATPCNHLNYATSNVAYGRTVRPVWEITLLCREKITLNQRAHCNDNG